MKSLFLILIILVTVPKVKAQVNQAQFDTCNYYHQFEGEWKYINGIDTIRFYFKVLRKYFSPYEINGIAEFADRLIGWHEYKQGSNIIESNYQYRNLPLVSSEWYEPPLFYSFSLSYWRQFGGCNINSRKLSGTFIDISRQAQECQSIIEINPAITEMHFVHWPHAPCKVQPCGTTLPAEMTLIKQ